MDKVKTFARSLIVLAVLSSAARAQEGVEPSLLQTPSRHGAPGLRHLVTAFPGPGGNLLLGGDVGGFQGGSFVVDDMLASEFSLHWSVTRWLGLFSNFQFGRAGKANFDPPVLRSGVDIGPGLIAAADGGDFSVGALFKLLVIGGVRPKVFEWDATGMELLALASFAPRSMGPERPLRLHLNAGYIIDRTRSLYPAGVIPPTVRFASSIADGNRLPVSVGVEYLQQPFGLSLEYAAEFSSGAGMVSWLMPAVRIGLTSGLYFSLGASIGITEDPNEKLPATIPWLAQAGLSWWMDPVKLFAPGPVIPVSSEPERVMVSRAKVVGAVKDSKSGKAVNDATVAFPGTDLSSILTNAEGRYQSAEMEPGDAKLKVTAIGYEDREAFLQIPAEGKLTANIDLVPIPPEDYATVQGRIEDEKGNAQKATIAFPKERRLANVKHEVEGDYAFKIPPGKVYAEVRAPGRLATGLMLDTKRKEKVETPKMVMREARVDRAKLTKDRIEIRSTIKFETGKDTILEDSYGIIDEVVDILLNNPRVKIRLEGHTDNVGSADRNTELSLRRVLNVKAFLISRGVDPGRLDVAGFGPERPIAPNDDDEGRARNRRVEFVVVE